METIIVLIGPINVFAAFGLFECKSPPDCMRIVPRGQLLLGVFAGSESQNGFAIAGWLIFIVGAGVGSYTGVMIPAVTLLPPAATFRFYIHIVGM